MKPAISIVMPMYGVEAYIARAIESVQKQTFTDWELLIVNDGTKDRSRDIAADYERKDERIRIIDKTNGGLSSARLKGLESAQGTYISFIDSDDSLQPEYLEVLYSIIKRYDADVSMCSYNTVFGNSQTPVSLCFPQGTTILNDSEEILKDYFLPQIDSIRKGSNVLPAFMWLRLFRRDIISTDLFISERKVYKEDLVLTARLLFSIKKLVVINTPLYNYFINPGSLTMKYRENAWSMMKSLTLELFKVLDKFPEKLVHERRLGHLLFAVHFVLKNASRQNYSLYKKQFQDILKSELLMQAIHKASLFTVPRGFFVMVWSMKIRCPFLLYKYNKKRV
ncbi:glycosyltransferase family 2 protein [Sodaliphilus sp.]|uniref:glycosyltransferase family 2 protein n=1 Tax=Sodaliphilus sp. TaxID=2815818 RepID=UPI00388E9128